MKLTKKKLNELNVVNPYDLCKMASSQLYIAYYPASYGRLASCAAWQVIGIGFKTDPNGAWYNWGKKTFNVFQKSEKQSQLERAMEWVKETLGITKWEKDVFGGYQIEGSQAILKSKEGF